MVASSYRQVALIAAVVSILGTPVIAEPGHFVSGNNILEMCPYWVGSRPITDELVAEFGEVNGYVLGVYDSIALFSFAIEDFEFADSSCAPDSVTPVQVLRVVCKHLEENPAKAHLSGAGLIVKAFREAWPCLAP